MQLKTLLKGDIILLDTEHVLPIKLLLVTFGCKHCYTTTKHLFMVTTQHMIVWSLLAITKDWIELPLEPIKCIKCIVLCDLKLKNIKEFWIKK